MTEDEINEYISYQLTQEIRAYAGLGLCGCGRCWHGMPKKTTLFYLACEGSHE